MTRIFKFVVPVLTGVAVVASAGCGRTSSPVSGAAGVSAEPLVVTTAVAARVQWPDVYEAGGVVRARHVAVLSARVVAPVLEVRVRAGDRVRRGQALVVLDGRELQAQSARAEAAAQGATLGLDATRAERQAAEAALTLAQVTYDRVSGLAAKNSATTQELDQARAALAGAEARVAGARARVAEAEQGSAAARAGREAAVAGVSYTTLTAPFDGLVSARHVDPGTLAAPGTPLLTIEDMDAFRLEARVDASHAQLVAPGATVEVQLDGAAGGAWQTALIAEVGNLDPGRHSFLVKADLASGLAQRSGQFGRMRVLGPAHPVLAVPAASIIRRGQVAFAFVADAGGVARLRMVSTGGVRGDQIEILAGIDEGEHVVAEPPVVLTDGRQVRAAAPSEGGAVR